MQSQALFGIRGEPLGLLFRPSWSNDRKQYLVPARPRVPQKNLLRARNAFCNVHLGRLRSYISNKNFAYEVPHQY